MTLFGGGEDSGGPMQTEIQWQHSLTYQPSIWDPTFDIGPNEKNNSDLEILDSPRYKQ